MCVISGRGPAAISLGRFLIDKLDGIDSVHRLNSNGLELPNEPTATSNAKFEVPASN